MYYYYYLNSFSSTLTLKMLCWLFSLIWFSVLLFCNWTTYQNLVVSLQPFSPHIKHMKWKGNETNMHRYSVPYVSQPFVLGLFSITVLFHLFQLDRTQITNIFPENIPTPSFLLLKLEIFCVLGLFLVFQFHSIIRAN
jgi:hypothetical protein